MDIERPVLIYDGDCGFCRRWIERWRDITGNALDYAPYQEAGPRFPEIALKEFESSVILVEPENKISRGAEAVFRSLSAARSHRWLLWSYEHLPGMKPASEALYRLVAANRAFFSSITRLLRGADVRRPSYSAASSIFTRLMGAVYLIAFVSLGGQIMGLIGSGGILPAEPYLEAVRKSVGPERFHLLPTIFWWIAPTDSALKISIWAGAALFSRHSSDCGNPSMDARLHGHDDGIRTFSCHALALQVSPLQTHVSIRMRQTFERRPQLEKSFRA